MFVNFNPDMFTLHTVKIKVEEGAFKYRNSLMSKIVKFERFKRF